VAAPVQRKSLNPFPGQCGHGPDVIVAAGLGMVLLGYLLCRVGSRRRTRCTAASVCGRAQRAFKQIAHDS
jgi:hypothetical protein